MKAMDGGNFYNEAMGAQHDFQVDHVTRIMTTVPQRDTEITVDDYSTRKMLEEGQK